MIGMLLLGLALVVAAALGVALLELLVRRADVAAALVFGSVVVQAYFIDRVPALVLPGGVQVYLTDMVASLILGAAVLRLLRLPRFDRFQRWLLLLGVLLLVSLVRGVAAFGMQPSIADFRQYLFFGGVAVYFASFPVSIRLYDRIGRIWLAITIPMMLLVSARWLAVFGGIDLGVPAEKYGADAAIRVIDGPFTFFLAHAFVLTIPAWTWMRRERDRWIRWVSVLLLLFCLVLNRRTVWLAIVVGVAVLMLRDRRLGRRALVLVALGGVMTAVAFVWLGGLQEGSEPVVRSGSGNLSWRVQGWSDVVTSWSRSPADWAIGQPVGSGFTRRVEGIVTNTQYGLHNFYIEILVRTGFVGLVALVALTAGLLRALWHAPTRDAGLLGPGVLPALLAMQIVWYITWPPGNEQGIVTGLAITVAAAGVSRPRRPARPGSVSVVVPAYNAAATLGEQLEALAAQPYEGDWELVVVDNGSTDGTADLARRHHRRFPAFTLVDGGLRRGHSAPRNAGARAARGELLAYCDADDVVAPGWLQAIADAACRYDLVGGWLDVEPLNDEATRSWHQPWPRDRLRSWLLPYAVSANLAVWADVLRELGGWSSEYEASGEDTELSWRAQLAGLRLGFAPDAVVYYRYRPGLWQTARQAYGIGVNCEHILHDYRFLRDEDHPGAHRGSLAPATATGARWAAPSGAPPGWRPGSPTSPARDATAGSGSRSPANSWGGSRGPPATGSSTAGAHEVSRSLPDSPSRPCTRPSGKLRRPWLGTVLGGRRCG